MKLISSLMLSKRPSKKKKIEELRLTKSFLMMMIVSSMGLVNRY